MKYTLGVLSKKYLIHLLVLSFLLLTLIMGVNYQQRKSLDLRTSAKQAGIICGQQMGSVCISQNGCFSRGGVNFGKYDCVGNTTCCYLGESIPTPTPIPEPIQLPLRTESQGNLIKAASECYPGGPITIYIIDDGVDERPNGVWTYMIMPDGETAYLAYTGPDGENSSATVYGVTNPIRGDVRQTILSEIEYTAGIAPGGYGSVTSLPELGEPRYEVRFTTPNCE